MKEKLQNLPVLVFFVLGIAIAAYKYTSILSDTKTSQDQIEAVKTQLTEKKTNLTKAKSASSEIPNIKIEIENLSQSLSHAGELIPTNISYREILTNISKEAKTAGIRVLETKPGETQTSNYFDILPLSVEFEGSYSQLTNYMYLLSRLKIILQPTDMSLNLKEIVDGQTNLQMSGKMMAFKYKETK